MFVRNLLRDVFNHPYKAAAVLFVVIVFAREFVIGPSDGVEGGQNSLENIAIEIGDISNPSEIHSPDE